MSEETALCINDVHVVYPNSPYPVLRAGVCQSVKVNWHVCLVHQVVEKQQYYVL